MEAIAIREIRVTNRWFIFHPSARSHEDRTHQGLRKYPVADFVLQDGIAFSLAHDSVACTIRMSTLRSNRILWQSRGVADRNNLRNPRAGRRIGSESSSAPLRPIL